MFVSNICTDTVLVISHRDHKTETFFVRSTMKTRLYLNLAPVARSWDHVPTHAGTHCTVSTSISVQHVRCFSMVFLICAYVHFRLFLEFRGLKISNSKIRDGGRVKEYRTNLFLWSPAWSDVNSWSSVFLKILDDLGRELNALTVQRAILYRHLFSKFRRILLNSSEFRWIQPQNSAEFYRPKYTSSNSTEKSALTSIDTAQSIDNRYRIRLHHSAWQTQPWLPPTTK